MMLDLFLLGFRNILRRRTRSWLTVLGILIGTAAVVALISVGQGLQRSVVAQVERIVGYNTLLITSRGGLAGRFQLDIDALRAVRGVQAVMPVRTETVYAEGPVGRGFLPLVGYTPAMEALVPQLQMEFREGSGLVRRDQVVLGARTADVLGAEPGDVVLVEDRAFRVAGTLIRQQARAGPAGLGGIPLNDGLLVQYEALRELFPGPNLVQYAMVQLVPGVDVVLVRSDVRRVLLETGTTGAFLTSFEDVTEGIGTILGGVQAFLAGIAGISILVGGVGVMNTMYTAVLERTREVGVAKAVGAKRRQILLVFLFESGLMGAVGGVMGFLVGVGLGWGAVWLTGHLFALEGLFVPVFSPTLVLGALVFSFVVGAASGALPALRASRLHPVDALRRE